MFKTQKHIFVIKQISPSRKEVRLILRSATGDEFLNGPHSKFQTEFKNILGSVTDNTHTFDYILSLAKNPSIQVPVVNYIFDSISKPDFTSLILKLNTPLPTGFSLLDEVNIDQELITTQTEKLFYSEQFIANINYRGLAIDTGLSDVDNHLSANTSYQDYNDLTSSFSDLSVVKSIVSASDENLNVDFSKFENHIIFGSAKEKLINFKYKVGKIEGYYNQLSQSLYAASGSVSMSGDSTYIKNTRKGLFDKINDEIANFTPYEKFLYYDAQNTATSSAPGIGKNYVANPAVNVHFSGSKMLTNQDGFNTVYKLKTNKDNFTTSSLYPDYKEVGVFSGLYNAQDKPFFNYSGSLYLSFLIKADQGLAGRVASGQSLTGGVITTNKLGWRNTNPYYDIFNNTEIHNIPGLATFNRIEKLPALAFGGLRLIDPTYTGSEWRRVVFEASQSYWRPNIRNPIGGDIANIDDFNINSSQLEVLSGSNVASASDSSSALAYPISAPGLFYSGLGTVMTGSGVPFTGSIMPAGELFHITMNSGSYSTNFTSSFITDVKITKNDPRDAYPFAYTYKTGSSTWSNWYDGMILSASAYDEKNIHSLENNLPSLIRQADDSVLLKKFLSMVGEHYDLVRNYIDNYLTFHSRHYKNYYNVSGSSADMTVPDNLLPILASNLGWELLSPFSSSLADYYGTSLHGDITTVKHINDSTWRKVLNNLMYIYKTKGTRNSVNALLNIYGYPDGALELTEYGLGSQNLETSLGTGLQNKAIPEGISSRTGSHAINVVQRPLYSWILNGDVNRILNFDWWTNNTQPEAVEFVFKSKKSSNTQQILKSSGSGVEAPWDLILEPSASTNHTGRLKFRLNTNKTGSAGNTIASNAFSMSSDYLPLQNNQFWNVLLQRMTSSVSGAGIQNYELYVSHQNKDKINYLSIASMSLSGSFGNDSGSLGNQNWQTTTSLDSTSSNAVSGNLYIGETMTGSIAEFRTWKYPVSASDFRLHTLNKHSVSITGSNPTASFVNLIYHYALQENWQNKHFGVYSGSKVANASNKKIKDKNINKPDYSLNIKHQLITGSLISSSLLYDYDVIDFVEVYPKDVGTPVPATSKIVIMPQREVIHPLSPFKNSYKSIYDSIGESSKAKLSNKIEIVKSPQKKLDEFFISQLGDIKLSDYFADPKDVYENSYKDLDNLFNDLIDKYGIEVNINKWIRAQSKTFNKSVLDAIESILPARIAPPSVGILIRPTILDKPKAKSIAMSVVTGSDAGILDSADVDLLEHIKFTDSAPESIYTGTYALSSSIDLTESILDDTEGTYNLLESMAFESTNISTEDGTYDLFDTLDLTDSNYHKSYDGSLDINELIVETSEYLALKEDTINVNDLIIKTGEYAASKEGNIKVNDIISEIGYYESSKNGTLFVDDVIVENAEYFDSKKGTISINDLIIKTGENFDSKKGTISIDDLIIETGDYVTSKDGHIDIENVIIKTGEYAASKEGNVDLSDLIIKTGEHFISTDGNIKLPLSQFGEYVTIPEGSNSEFKNRFQASFVDLSKKWGRTIDDTWFINESVRPVVSGGYAHYNHQDMSKEVKSGSYNVNHYEPDFVFEMFGRMEIITGSIAESNKLPVTDFHNPNHFLNQEIRDVGKGYKYTSYIKNTKNNDTLGIQDGRPVGETSYYQTASDGTLLYPSNHIVKIQGDRSDYGTGLRRVSSFGTLNSHNGGASVPTKDILTGSYVRLGAVTASHHSAILTASIVTDNFGNTISGITSSVNWPINVGDNIRVISSSGAIQTFTISGIKNNQFITMSGGWVGQLGVSHSASLWVENEKYKEWNRDATKVHGYPGFLQPNPGSEWTDLSSASFYSIRVAGENRLKVAYGKEQVSSTNSATATTINKTLNLGN